VTRKWLKFELSSAQGLCFAVVGSLCGHDYHDWRFWAVSLAAIFAASIGFFRGMLEVTR
jgi:uncharacterized membrane protein YoaK (UPF0700 family)